MTTLIEHLLKRLYVNFISTKLETVKIALQFSRSLVACEALRTAQAAMSNLLYIKSEYDYEKS